ncbi:Metallo-beta-lactamase protein [Mycena sanguinolenta]|uniref:Metallo-beta-lactamase protein n=1 Tax=Mycena sanguinolenta TaxID=230812 RepID=A0A8H7CU55_9AGAR|nr:Metallo-beta-lactamase protein [Mycena sanguinolenta]
MYYSQWSTGPLAPRLSTISLPPESPRPASAFSERQPWPTSSFTSQRQNPIATAPARRFGRDDGYARTTVPFVPPEQNSFGTASARAFDRDYQYGRDPVPASYSVFRTDVTAAPSDPRPGFGRRQHHMPASSEASSSTSHRSTAERTRTSAMTSVPAAPLKSILKSSRTRSQSISSNPEAPSSRPSAAVPPQVESRRSSLSKPPGFPRIKPLKAEAISLSWPLVQFSARGRSSNPMLYFDVGFDPRQAINLQDNKSNRMAPMSTTDQNLPVSTHCTVTDMVIECPHIGDVIIKRPKGILCIDVFSAIYDAYRELLGDHELPEDIGRYARHFHRRCHDSPNSTAEQNAGMRRVDLLKGKRIFDGLTRSGANWKLGFDA